MDKSSKMNKVRAIIKNTLLVLGLSSCAKRMDNITDIIIVDMNAMVPMYITPMIVISQIYELL